MLYNQTFPVPLVTVLVNTLDIDILEVTKLYLRVVRNTHLNMIAFSERIFQLPKRKVSFEA